MQNLITKHLDIWTSAHKTRSTAGRGSNNKLDLVGIKKLRELILELAVRGKLVQQDPNDEPASELLKRIAAKKTQLIEEGKLKKDKAIHDANETEKPFDIPNKWQWSKLSAIAIINPRNSAEDELKASFVPMTLIDSRFDGGHEQELRTWKDIKQGFTHFAEGDIGVAKITPCFENSKACVFKNLANKIGAGTTELHIVRPISNTLNPRYVLACLKSPSFLLVGETKMTGTAGQKRLPKEFLESYPFALPPLPEQHRIVAKVDELMAFCDQLEQTQSDNIAAHAQLVEALLATLVQSGSTASRSPRAEGSVRGELVEPHPSTSSVQSEFEENWQRIAAHFDTLFTTEYSIDQLKQTILQLAVMGKLVPQNPNDEPASELLKKIAAEKAQLIKEGKIKKEKPLLEITDEEKPFELPEGWEWEKLSNITTGMDSGWSPACLANSSPSKEVWGVLKTTAVQIMEYLEFENKELPENLTPRPDAEVKQGDILFTRAGPMNRVGISCLVEKTRPRLMISDKIIRFHLVEIGIYGRFISLCLNAGGTATYLERAKSGMAASQVNISQEKLRSAPIPIPPLAEQHRIVAKVEELMTLCDSLKTNLQNAQTTQLALADALVGHAIA
jgi:type I restriction enzyme S subunit